MVAVTRLWRFWLAAVVASFWLIEVGAYIRYGKAGTLSGHITAWLQAGGPKRQALFAVVFLGMCVLMYAHWAYDLP